MRYVYLLQSEAVVGQRYVGVASDLKQRLAAHLDLAGDYSEAIRLKPDYALAFQNRGIAYRKLGHRALSDEDFRKARELDPNL